MVARFISALQSQITNGTKVAGQIIFARDSRQIYWDADNETRLLMSDVIDIDTEDGRANLSSPLNKFYYVVETGRLWRYRNGWHLISGDSSGGDGGVDFIVSETQPASQDTGDFWLQILE